MCLLTIIIVFSPAGRDGSADVQKDIVYAATILSEKDRNFETDELCGRTLLEGVSRSSFFRALKDVVEAGYLNHCDGTQRSVYELSDKMK